MTFSARQEPEAAADVEALWAQRPGLGEKLRLRRKLRKLSLKAVAEKAGLSIGLLSQVERGLTTPSIRSLRAICEALDMPALWLFERSGESGGEESDVVVRREARRRLAYVDSGLHKEILTPDAQPQIQLLRFVLQPGADSGEPYSDLEGGKCGIVLRGALGLSVDGRSFTIRAGDSFAFPATSLVRFWSLGEEVCEVIWGVAPATV